MISEGFARVDASAITHYYSEVQLTKPGGLREPQWKSRWPVAATAYCDAIAGPFPVPCDATLLPMPWRVGCV